MSNAITAEEYDKLCQDYMDALYQGVSGFVTYEPGEKEEAADKKIFMTYGEILYAGVNRLIDYMGLTENDVIYDMGSGVGKVPLQFFLKTPVKKSWGIEAHTKRHESAVHVYKQVRRELPDLFAGGRDLKSECRHFFDTDISDATVLFIASSCYSEELMQDLGKMADQCPHLRCIASHKPIPNKLPLTSIIDIECSWDKAKSHFYGKIKDGMPVVGLDSVSNEE